MKYSTFLGNCQWSNWSAYGSCSRNCGGGTRKYKRYKTVKERNGGKCYGSYYDYKTCNTQTCSCEFPFLNFNWNFKVKEISHDCNNICNHIYQIVSF